MKQRQEKKNAGVDMSTADERETTHEEVVFIAAGTLRSIIILSPAGVFRSFRTCTIQQRQRAWVKGFVERPERRGGAKRAWEDDAEFPPGPVGSWGGLALPRAAQGCPGCSFRAALRTMGIRDSWPGTMRLFDQHVHISTSTCQPRSSQARGWFLSALRHIECRTYTKEHPKPRCGDVCVTGATLFLLSNPRSRVGQSPDLNLTRLWARCGHPKLPRTLAAYPCAYPCRRATLLEDPGSPLHAPTACGDFLPSLQKSHVSLRAPSLKADAEA
jgi:hypothetical protein